MKNKGLIIPALVAILLLSNIASGCGGAPEITKPPVGDVPEDRSTPGITKPTIGYIPEDWYCSDEDSYGTYEETDGTKWGLIEYTDDVDWDFAQIFYGDVPPELQGNENNGTALIGRATLEAVTFDPEETGTMTVAGRLAGYVKAYDASLEVYEIEIVFVIDSTCIDIYAMYDATSENEAQVMSLLNSIN